MTHPRMKVGMRGPSTSECTGCRPDLIRKRGLGAIEAVCCLAQCLHAPMLCFPLCFCSGAQLISSSSCSSSEMKQRLHIQEVQAQTL